MSQAISCCHNNNIIHRDIKLNNFIVMSDGNIRLSDFDFANHADSTTLFRGISGTPDFISPEMVESKRDGIGYTRSTDIWSLGIAIYDLYTGNLPFGEDDTTNNQIYINILEFINSINPAIKNIDDIPTKYRVLITRLLKRESERPNIDTFLNLVKTTL